MVVSLEQAKLHYGRLVSTQKQIGELFQQLSDDEKQMFKELISALKSEAKFTQPAAEHVASRHLERVMKVSSKTAKPVIGGAWDFGKMIDQARRVYEAVKPHAQTAVASGRALYQRGKKFVADSTGDVRTLRDSLLHGYRAGRSAYANETYPMEQIDDAAEVVEGGRALGGRPMVGKRKLPIKKSRFL